MTYCVERTKLLASAGRELATMLLPKPFALWYSNHDTGCQMTIIAPKGNVQEFSPAVVWKGSIWHSHIYEFNDRGDIPGLQPDFEFAREVIDRYFQDVQKAVDARQAERDAADAARVAEIKVARYEHIEDVRRQLEGLR